VGAVVDVLKAGTDSDCGDWFASHLAKVVVMVMEVNLVW
jgi:hypothetical protein